MALKNVLLVFLTSAKGTERKGQEKIMSIGGRYLGGRWVSRAKGSKIHLLSDFL